MEMGIDWQEAPPGSLFFLMIVTFRGDDLFFSGKIRL
jgi:hypothetical protein